MSQLRGGKKLTYNKLNKKTGQREGNHWRRKMNLKDINTIFADTYSRYVDPFILVRFGSL